MTLDSRTGRPPEASAGATPTAETPARPPLRADIQGLRAIAVGLVVLFHLWPNRLPGGYIGVDVFFVISGFLITGHLLRDIELSGRVRLTRFWMRRIRRLLPSALLVLVVSAIGVFLVVPRQYWSQFFREIGAAALYVQNWALAGDSVDYLAAENDPSPVQHFWSLSVEEQFYVGLPLLLLLVTLIARGRRRRPAILGALGLMTVASLAWSIHLTAVSAPSAYFVTTTRLWELGIGAFVSVAPVLVNRTRRILLSTTGFLVILASALTITGETPFPGWVALFPVLGTAVVIWAGMTGARLEPARLLDTPVVRWVGDHSYAIYLWHWPLIVLLPFALGRTELGLVHKLGILLATAALSWFSARFIEDPIRFARGPRATSTKVVFPAMLVGMAVAVAVAGVGLQTASRAAAESLALTARIVAEDPACLGAKAITDNGQPCVNPDLDGVLVPSPDQVDVDKGRDNDCWTGPESDALHVCQVGPADSPVRILAVGDSHNDAFLPTYRAMAEERGWSVDVTSKNVCYLTTSPQPKSTPTDAEACESWKARAFERIESTDYDLVVVTHGANNRAPVADTPEARRDLVVTGMREAWTRVLATGARVVAIQDNPLVSSTTIDCVAREREDANRACVLDRDTALRAFDGSKEAAEGLEGVTFVDYTDVYCTAEKCDPLIGNVPVYRDLEGHITATFALTLAPRLSEDVARALD